MKHCLIIGAGISGLMAARTLSEKGIDVTVLEKSRGVGGRLATRRFGGGVFDHGAQYISARSDIFKAQIDILQKAGVVQEWSTGAPPDKSEGFTHYIGVRGMTGIAKFLARELDLRLGERALFLSFKNKKWQILTEKENSYETDAIILTPPVPQSLALIRTAGLERQEIIENELHSIFYDRCLTVLVIMHSENILDAPGGLRLSGEPLIWISDNQMKGISPRRTAVTIHAGPEFSRKYWEMDDRWIAQNILYIAAGWLPGKYGTYQVKRWLYSQPRIVYDDRYYAIPDPAPLIFAGDAFGGPQVEGAALSGIFAAQVLSQQYG